jgi:hypothetical protein
MYALSVDHKSGDAKRVMLKSDDGEVGTQTFTIVGDLGLVLNCCVVPDTHGDWTDIAIDEVMSRHEKGKEPKFLYVDCGCSIAWKNIPCYKCATNTR